MNPLLRISGARGILLMALFCTGTGHALAQGSPITLENVKQGMTAHGFRATALYADDTDRPMGARFVHEKTGFQFDLLRIQSVPQGYMWVNSLPTSDMGEPHTQEHLLLGKGNKGRYVANLEDMSLGSSTAFTQQWRTSYHFNTGAGPEVYYRLLEEQLDALLHPNYTDEEIRREVCNFGVSQNPADKSLRLEEKGTVYNEMVSSFERPWTRLAHAIDIAVYGKDHPIAYVSGGLPSAIREMKPEDIRRFHREHYFLGNMGMIASLPKEMALDDVLRRTDAMLLRLNASEQNGGQKREGNLITEETLPAPQGAAPGSFITAEFPNKNEATPAPVVFVWPAQLSLTAQERLSLELFLSNFASDASTNLYKLFIDTKTRKMDVGAQGVFSWVADDQGNPIHIGLDSYAPANMTEAKLAEIRNLIVKELERVASWKDNSPELKEFNNRLMSRVISTRRDMAKFVNSPPGFGFRGTLSNWMDHLDYLEELPDFRKSVTLRPELDAIETRMKSGKNFWKNEIKRWKITETQPYMLAARPSAAMVEKEESDRRDRITAQVASLKSKYGTSDEQQAISRYGQDYDATTAELDSIAAQTTPIPFIDTPPLTLDDQLDFRQTTLAGGVPMVASTFDNMTSTTVGMAFRLDEIPEKELVYISLLPALLSDVGVIENGKALSYEQMTEKIRQQILTLTTYFSSNNTTGRCELVVRGAGNDLSETQRSLEWMQMVLHNPNWTAANLPRIRDLVDQTLAGLRNTMQGREEAWVNNPAGAYRRQDNLHLLATQSFLTRAHNAHRLRWMLKDAGKGASRDAISQFLSGLSSASSAERADLVAMLAAMTSADKAAQVPASLQSHYKAFNALPADARAIAVDAAKDLAQTLGEIPDGTISRDWAYLCAQMKHDLMTPPANVLENLNSVRKRILHAANARMFMIGSRSSQEKLSPGIGKLVSSLGTGERAPARPINASTRHISQRVQERMRGARPLFVGLLNPNTGSGVVINSAPNVSYRDTSRSALLDYLAGQVFGGGGSHGMFMKTWGAGLAYSNGIGSSPASGRINYYAERCPELPQTVRFVIDEIRKAPVDPGLTDYAIAQAFQEFRSASNYETRGESMANDLTDGTTPDVVRTFRQKLLALKNTPGLADEIFGRREKVYGKILPGYGVPKKDVEDGVYFIIGPEKQLGLYEEYLKSVEGDGTSLYRLYPRDFWIPLREIALEVQRN